MWTVVRIIHPGIRRSCGTRSDTPGVRVDSADHRITRCSSYTVVVTHNLGISYPQLGTNRSAQPAGGKQVLASVGSAARHELGKGCRRCGVRTAGILTRAWWTPGR